METNFLKVTEIDVEGKKESQKFINIDLWNIATMTRKDGITSLFLKGKEIEIGSLVIDCKETPQKIKKSLDWM
jgi:hypothetical protein